LPLCTWQNLFSPCSLWLIKPHTAVIPGQNYIIVFVCFLTLFFSPPFVLVLVVWTQSLVLTRQARLTFETCSQPYPPPQVQGLPLGIWWYLAHIQYSPPLPHHLPHKSEFWKGHQRTILLNALSTELLKVSLMVGKYRGGNNIVCPPECCWRIQIL
jgi:hypothetical protein